MTIRHFLNNGPILFAGALDAAAPSENGRVPNIDMIRKTSGANTVLHKVLT